MIELMENQGLQAEIKVIGVGGGGGNAVEHMMKTKMEGVTFINANTDSQVLERSTADITLQLGENTTRGLGAGANPEVGRQAAMEDRDRIAEAIDGADMVFITAGLGGGTGTGAAPVVAELAKEKGILTVAVVTTPFMFEGAKRMKYAEQGVEQLESTVDSLITIPNDKILDYMGEDTTMEAAFAEANQVLLNAVQGIAELITRPGVINVDFADVRTVMSEMGMAMMGSAVATGENRAERATRNAISSPLLEDTELQGARGMLVNVTAGEDLTIGEFSKIGKLLHAYVSPEANVVIGTAVDPELDGELRVTVVATGLGEEASATEAPVIKKEERQPTAPEATQPDSESVAPTHFRPRVRPDAPERPSYSPQRRRANGGFDVADYDVPSYLRNQQAD